MEGNYFLNNNVNCCPNFPAAGGLYCKGALAVVTNNVFKENIAGRGGGITSEAFTTLVNNTFLGNQIQGFRGGAAYLTGGGVVADNVFEGNSATVGGASYFATGDYTVERNEFRNNSASGDGGAIYLDGAAVVFRSNLVVDNQQTGGTSAGGGICIRTSTTVDVINNTVSGNEAMGDGGGVALTVEGTEALVNFYNNILWGNAALGAGGDVAISGTGASKKLVSNLVHSVSGVWDVAEGNIDVAPDFFDPINGDYHIPDSSVCKDAGDNDAPSLPTLDLDLEPRVAGGTVDIGCFEFATTAAHPADVNADFVIDTGEFDAYAEAWKNGEPWSIGPRSIPADYLTRAGYLFSNGGSYLNDGSRRPTNWKVVSRLSQGQLP